MKSRMSDALALETSSCSTKQYLEAFLCEFIWQSGRALPRNDQLLAVVTGLQQHKLSPREAAKRVVEAMANRR